MKIYERKAIFDDLKNHDVLAKDHDSIEIVEWYNGEGFDVEVSSANPQRFQLTWGEFDALKKLIKKLNKKMNIKIVEQKSIGTVRNRYG